MRAYVFRAAQHPSNTVCSRVQCKQISAGFDIKIDSVFVAHFGYAYVGLPLMKSFHCKKKCSSVSWTIFQESSRTPSKPPKSQQTRKGWTPKKEETWTILGRYHGIQVFYLGKYQASRWQILVKHGFRTACITAFWWPTLICFVPKCSFTCQHVGKLGSKHFSSKASYGASGQPTKRNSDINAMLADQKGIHSSAKTGENVRNLFQISRKRNEGAISISSS